MDLMSLIDMEESLEHPKNEQFYSNCTAYFEFLHSTGETDYDFEDEYYFTMPAISSE